MERDPGMILHNITDTARRAAGAVIQMGNSPELFEQRSAQYRAGLTKERLIVNNAARHLRDQSQ